MSLIDKVTPEMDVYRDEIFGPVLCVVRAESYDEAVRLIDENPYGTAPPSSLVTAAPPVASSSTCKPG